jgi:hypothetical protein
MLFFSRQPASLLLRATKSPDCPEYERKDYDQIIGTGSVPEPFLFFKWTKDEFETFLVDNFAISERETYERLVGLATRSGTPEVISDIVYSGEMNQVNKYERHVQTTV